MTCPHCGAASSADARFCGVCGRATSATEPSYQNLGPGPAPTGDLVGRDIAGRYRVLAKLGEGGMGAVYRGEQISLKRKVAIKVLRPELSRDPGLVRRFNAEAELAAKLSHPNTVNIYDFGQDVDGSLFIAMEFLEGRSLRQVMTQEGPLPPARALAIMRQVCASLSDAHAHGIVHRDLKPDNVMLTERGKDRDVARVLDFGIAKLRDDDRQTVNAMTRAGDLVGTPQYMAPEQIKGEKVDGRTDIYALGAMLYEMVTGRLPFEGATVMAILSKHLIEVPEAPTVRRPDLGLPPALDGLVMGALAKDPAHRPPTMDYFAEQVAAIAGPLTAPTGAVPSAMVPAATPPPSTAIAPPQAALPAGPPPGVPRSYPPGTLTPRPNEYGLAPAVGAPGSEQPPAPPRSSRAPVYVAIGVVVAAAIAIAVVIGLKATGGEAGGGTGSAGSDDPWGGGAPPADPADPWAGGTAPSPGDRPNPGDPPPTAESEWGSYRHPDFGWTLRLPPGVATTPTEANGSMNFTGLQGGTTVVVGALALPNAGAQPTADVLEQFADELAKSLDASVTESGYVVTNGTRRYRVEMSTAVDKGEARFYVEPSFILIAYYTRTGDWDERAAERRQFFEGVGLPGGSP